jgi:hypothetical protein
VARASGSVWLAPGTGSTSTPWGQVTDVSETRRPKGRLQREDRSVGWSQPVRRREPRPAVHRSGPDHESADLWRDRVTKALTATQMGAVAARYTAARLLTIAGAPTHAPIEVAVPPDCHPAPRPGIRPLRTLVGQSELAEVDGIVTTGPLRMVLDCARYPATSSRPCAGPSIGSIGSIG